MSGSANIEPSDPSDLNEDCLESHRKKVLQRVSTAIFPIALGIAGLGAGIRHLGTHIAERQVWALGMGLLAFAAFVLALEVSLYFGKVIGSRDDAAQDFEQATRANFVAPAFMAGMIIGGGFSELHIAGFWLWLISIFSHTFLLIRFAGRWMKRSYDPNDLNPTWFMPSAGLMTGAMTWPGIGPSELPWFALAAGGAVWIGLLPLVCRRLIFEPPLSARLRPTLFIVAAPFGIAANSVIALNGDAGLPVATFLACAGAFNIFVFMFQPRFLFEAGFSLSWWATTFPVASVGIALLRVSSGKPYFEFAGFAMIAAATVSTVIATIATGLVARSSRMGAKEAAEFHVADFRGKQV